MDIFLAFNASFSITGLLTPFSISTFTYLASSLLPSLLTFQSSLRVSRFLFLLFLFPLYSLVQSLFIFNSQTFGYLVALLVVYFLLPLIFSRSLAYFGTKFFNKINAFAVLTCSSFSILEFFLYFVGIDVHSIVPRSDAFTADALIGGSILAVAILSLLSPQFLLFSISLGSIAAYHFYITKRFIPLIIIVFSFFTTFSSSTIGALIISFFIVLFLYFSLKFLFSFNSYTLRKSVLFGLIITFSLSIFVILFLQLQSNPVFLTIFQKLTFTDINQGSGRLTVWQDGFTLLKSSNFIPYGVGYLSSIKFSVINTYLLYLIELGPLGLVLSLLPFLYLISKLSLASIRKNSVGDLFFLFFLTSSVIQLISFSTFYTLILLF